MIKKIVKTFIIIVILGLHVILNNVNAEYYNGWELNFPYEWVNYNYNGKNYQHYAVRTAGEQILPYKALSFDGDKNKTWGNGNEEDYVDGHVWGYADIQSLINTLNQSTYYGPIDMNVNKNNINDYFNTSPKDLVNKNIGSYWAWSDGSLGLNSSCWHHNTIDNTAILDSGDRYYSRIIRFVITIKNDGIYATTPSYTEKKILGEDDAKVVQKIMYSYFCNYGPDGYSGENYHGWLGQHLKYNIYNKLSDNIDKSQLVLLNNTNSGADNINLNINNVGVNDRMPLGYEKYEYRLMGVSGTQLSGAQPVMLFNAREIPEEPNPDTGRIRAIKYDQYNPTVRLNGAKFILYDNDEKKYISKTSRISYQNEQYILNNIEYTDASNQAEIFLSGGKNGDAQAGYLDIINVPIPKGKNGKYSLIEIEAPSKYDVKELSTIEITVKKYDDDEESKDRYNRQNRLRETMDAYGISGYDSLLNNYANISDWADKDNEKELKMQQEISELRGKKDKNDANYYIMSDRYRDAKTLLLYSQTIGYSTGSILKNGNKNENGSLRIIKTSTLDSDKVIGGAKYVLYDEQGNCVTHNTSDITGKYKALWKSSKKEMDTVAKASSDTAYQAKAIFVTDSNGIIDIENLDTDHTYTLHEIEAPYGYYKAEDKTGIKVNSFANNGKCSYEYFRDTINRIIGNNFNKQKVINTLCKTLNKESSFGASLWKSTTSFGILNETFLYKGLTDYYDVTLLVKRANLLNNIDDFSDEASKNVVKKFVMDFYNNYTGKELTADNTVIQMYHKMIEGWTCIRSEEQPKNGNLELKKVEKEYNKPLKGIGFTIKNKSMAEGFETANQGKYVTGNGTYGTSSHVFKTNASGKITIKDLVPGIYTIEETYIPDGVFAKTFKTGYKEDIEVKPGETATTKGQKVENPHNGGEFQILKIDGLTGQKLSGFKFKLFILGKGWVKFKTEGDQYIYDGVTAHYKDAANVVTNTNGYTKLMVNMPLNEDVYVYERGGDNIPSAYRSKYASLFKDQKVIVGSGYYGEDEWAGEPVRECGSFKIKEKVKDYELENNEFSKITVQQIILNTSTDEEGTDDEISSKEVTLEKPEGKMELEGFAFIDTDKEQKNDGLFNDGTNGVYSTSDINDKPMPNVPVKVMKNNEQIKIIKDNKKVNEVKTDSKGEYSFALDVSTINQEIYTELKDIEDQITQLNNQNKNLAAQANDILSDKKEKEEAKNKAQAEKENLEALVSEANSKGSTVNVNKYKARITELTNTVNSKTDDLDKINYRVNKIKAEIQVNYNRAKELAEGYKQQFNHKFNDKMENYLKNIKIIFTYDGVEYECVERYDVSRLSSTSTSQEALITEGKNHEGAVSIVEEVGRGEFNNNFTEITGEGQKIKGSAVTYTPYKYGSGESETAAIKASGNFGIDSQTPNQSLSMRYTYLRRESKYNSGNPYAERLEKIDRINLGVYKRIKPNMSLEVNLSKATVNVNNKEMTYKYGDMPEATPGTPQALWEKLYSNIESDKLEYNLPVYPSDILDKPSTDPKSFKCQVEYRIRLINSSGGGLATTINSIEDYFSESYNIIGLYDSSEHKKSIGNIKVGSSNIQNDTAEGQKYKHYKFDNLAIELPAGNGNYKDLYLVLELDSNKVVSGNKDEYVFNQLKLRNRSEISSYTVKKDNKLYAGFDYNSVPNNYYTGKISAGNTKYQKELEDDCRYGKGLCLVNAGERTISGIVFEDESVLKETSVGTERNGNGKYDAGEKALSEVTVSLYRNGINEPVAVTKTNKGAYEFKGYAADDYHVVFTWGDKNIHAGDTKYSPTEYKSTIVKNGWAEENFINDQTATRWYASLNGESVAVDNAEARIAFENRVKNDVGTLYRDLKTLEDTDVLYGQISARTRLMDMKIENMDATETDATKIKDDTYQKAPYKAQNIDFGITKRPMPDMQIKKTISHVKFVDGQGRTLADSDVDENGNLTETDLNYIVSLPASAGNPFGTIKAEVDYYPIEVEVQYKVEVKNNSEVDYYSTEPNKLTHYYYYGVADNNTDKLITMKPEGIYDYMNEGYQLNSIDKPETNVITTELSGKTDEEIAKTVLEKAYDIEDRTVDMYGNTITTGLESTEKGILESIFEEWSSKTTITSTRQKKLDQNKVIKLESLEHEYNPGSSDSIALTATSTIAATIKEVNLSNEAEISGVKVDENRTTTPHKSYIPYGTATPRVTITPPTGENRDKTPTYIMTISAIVVLFAIGTGIIIIKKKHSNK